MIWIRNNPFIAGLIGVLAVCSAAFGFLTFSASGKYSAVYSDYKKQADELARLQNLTPYPEEANYKKLKERQEAYISQINGLVESVAKMQLPGEPLSPEKFQDELKAAVTRIGAKAQQNGASLPEKFYLGFEGYQTQPPKAEAAPLLGRQLRAIEMAMGIVLDARASLKTIRRQSLPAEEAQPVSAAAGKSAPKSAAKPADSKKLVSSTSFEIDLLAEQSQLRVILNALAVEQRQLFVVRSLRIANENPKAPTRAEIEAPVPVEQPAAGLPGQAVKEGGAPPSAASSLRFVVGDEKLLVSLKIDIMEFTMPKERKGR